MRHLALPGGVRDPRTVGVVVGAIAVVATLVAVLTLGKGEEACTGDPSVRTAPNRGLMADCGLLLQLRDTTGGDGHAQLGQRHRHHELGRGDGCGDAEAHHAA